MHFTIIFRTPFSKYLCFPTLLDSFFWNVVSNNAQSRCFIQCFQRSTKILRSTFKHLYLFERVFYKFRQFANMIFMFLLCVFMLLFQKKYQKKWSNYCLLKVRKRFFHILLGREDWKLLKQALTRHGRKKAQVEWLCSTLESCSKPFLGHGK